MTETLTAPEVRIVGDSLSIHFDRFDIASYGLFLKVKRLPESHLIFHPETETYTVEAPKRFAAMLDVAVPLAGAQVLPLAEYLFDDQTAITQMALDAKRFACWSDCGLGKGLRPDCPVLTPSGFAPLASLRIGDMVTGSNGAPTRIVGVFPRGVQPLYRVTFSDGVSIVCDSEHLWNVKSYNDVARGKPWRTMETRDIASTTLKYGTHGQSRTWQIPMVAPVRHPHADLPLDPYVVGVLLGDGSLASDASVTWSKPDSQVADRVRDCLPDGSQLRRHDSDARCPVWRVTGVGNRNPVLDALRGLGLMGRKSSQKLVPTQYLIADVEDRVSLLNGLMDTDGYAGESPEFCSTSEALADAVVQIVESFGGTASKATKIDPQYMHNDERRTGQTAYRVVMTLPAGINPFWLPRKANAYKTASRGLGRWIDSVESCGEGETICIKVEAADGLFVIDRHVVTHNTAVALEFGRHVMHRTGGRVLLITMNEIVPQFLEEAAKFYGDSLPLHRIRSRSEMKVWCKEGPGDFGITNYEKMNPDDEGQEVHEMRHLAGIILDESSRLKTGGGKQKWALIKSTKGIEYKLSCTATPAPNDVMEFASQASFLERMRSEADILWTFFNRDEKTHRWTVKPHARGAFFEFMSSWSIYVRDPRRYGWRLDHKPVPEPITTVHELAPTPEQLIAMRKYSTGENGQMLLLRKQDVNAIERAKLSQIAKGFVYLKGEKAGAYDRIPSAKPAFVADLIESEAKAGLQVLVWTVFDAESDLIAEQLLSRGVRFDLLTGKVKDEDRLRMLEDFRHGNTPVLVSRAAMLGYGQNFQMCRSMIFSGWNDSFEAYYQAVRRAYRHGQAERVRVHIPVVTELEGDMLENIFAKQAKHLAAVADMESNYIRARLDLGVVA